MLAYYPNGGACYNNNVNKYDEIYMFSDHTINKKIELSISGTHFCEVLNDGDDGRVYRTARVRNMKIFITFRLKNYNKDKSFNNLSRLMEYFAITDVNDWHVPIHVEGYIYEFAEMNSEKLSHYYNPIDSYEQENFFSLLKKDFDHFLIDSPLLVEKAYFVLS